MKRLALPLYLFLLFGSCNSDNTEQKSQDSSTDSSAFAPNDETKKASDNSQGSFPAWIKNIYEVDNNEYINDAIPAVIYFKILSDSVSFCLYQVDNGICGWTYLATQKNNKPYKKAELAKGCDGDFSTQISYSYSEYEQDPAVGSFKSIKYTETVKPGYYVQDKNGSIKYKEGYDFGNAETTVDTLITTVKVNPAGEIITKKNRR